MLSITNQYFPKNRNRKTKNKNNTMDNQSSCRNDATPRQCAVVAFETKHYDINTPRFAEGVKMKHII